MTQTQIICAISLVIFAAIMIAIGVISSRKAKTLNGFLLGGRNIGPWLSAFSYGTAYFSAVVFVGYAGMHGWNIGIGALWIGIANSLIGCLCAWALLAKRTRSMTRTLDTKTMPSFFEKRYVSRGMKMYAAVIIFVFLVPYAAGVYKGLGTLFSAVFGGNENLCMLIVAVLTAIYLILGGYFATSVNDFIQGIIMIAGIIILVFAIVMRPEVGGLAAGFEKLAAVENADLLNVFGGDSASFLLVNIALTSFGVFGLPQMVHKYYAIKDEKSIKIGGIVATAFAFIIGFGAYFIGLFGRFFAENGVLQVIKEDGTVLFDNVIPNMLITALGGSMATNILLSVILLLLLSASMSTLASIVLTSSSAVTVDLIKEAKPKMSEKSTVLLTRLFCFAFVALSYIFATMNISFIVNLMSFSWGIVAGSFIGPFIWGIYAKWITKAGAWTGLVSGLAVVGIAVIAITCVSGFDAAKSFAPQLGVAAMAVSFAITPIVSLFTKKYSKEHTDAVFAANK